MGSTGRKNTVCLLLKICPPGIDPEFMMECKLIAHPSWNCTRRNRSELIHCRAMKDQWDCVLNDLEELGDKEFLVLVYQCNIEIFSCFLRLLPLYSSTFHQTNVESEQNRSEDSSSISRIQSLHLLLEVDDHDEERTQLFWHWVSVKRILCWLNIGPKSFTYRYSSCRWASRGRSSRLCFSLWSARKANTFVVNAKSSDCIPEVSCSLLSSSLMFLGLWPTYWSYEQFWPTTEKCLCLQSSILISTPC